MLMVPTWKRIVEAEPSPICAFDHEFRLTAFNAAHSDQFFAIYGHRVQVGEVFPDLFLPEQRSIIRGFMARALSGEVFQVVEEFGNPDLSKPFWSISYAPLRDDTGVIIGAFHRAQDISAQLRSQAELVAARQALQEAKSLNWHLGRTLALFDDQVCDLTDAKAISGLAVKITGQTLNVDSIGLGALHPGGRTIGIDQVWNAMDAAVPLNPHATLEVSDYVDTLSGGDEFVVDDVLTDPRTQGTAESWQVLGVRSAISVWIPDLAESSTLFLVLSATPRVWDRAEVEFARTIATRMRTHSARAREDESHRATAARLAEEIRLSTRELERQALALHDSQDFARLALTAVGGVGVWTYDATSNRFFYDAAIAKLYGIDPDQGEKGLVSAEFLRNVHPTDLASLTATMACGLASPGDLELEYRLRHADGSIHWVLSRGHTYFDESGHPIRRTGVGIDLTKQRLLEEQLRQSQKMEAVGQLTGGLAHDFNNLLTAITGSLEMLTLRVQQGRAGEIDRYVHAAQGAAKRAAALTHRLLAFSRRQTLDSKPTDVNRLVSGLTELLQRTIGPAIELEFVGAGGLWSTLVDRGQLESALLNLAINARDAMPDGGKITIETGNKSLDERAARQGDLSPGQFITVCVSDTGTGMPPEVIARAFDPFFTTKPIGLGTGLGLSMVYGFARQSGGEVRIYSEINQGTKVCLFLPRYGGPADNVDEDYTATAIIPVDRSESVLVVDDEPTVRMLIVEVLQEMGCAALEAHDSTSGLKILRTDARIDLLITDVGLPGGMNGRQLADAARATRPKLKILFVTGYAENAVLSHGHLELGMHVLTKPFSVDDLMRRVKDLINH